MVSPEVLPHFDPPCQLSLRAAPNQKKTVLTNIWVRNMQKRQSGTPQTPWPDACIDTQCGFQTRMNLEML